MRAAGAASGGVRGSRRGKRAGMDAGGPRATVPSVPQQSGGAWLFAAVLSVYLLVLPFFKRVGADHIAMHVATVNLEGETAQGEGSAKGDAKRSAAAALILLLHKKDS